jgi:hypothetical protein
MEQEVARLRGSLAAVGCEDWLLPPASSDEIAEVVDAVCPHFLPDELIKLWSLHAGIKVESRASERFLGWSAPAEVLRRRAHWTDLGESYSYPSVWPYWNGDRWLPIAAADRSTFFVVLGDKPFRQSVVGVHSSSALDIRVQQSSLRSWVMSLDLVIGGLADLGIDARDNDLWPSGWWDTMEFHHQDPDFFPPLLLESLRDRLPGIAAIDAAVTWPEPTPLWVTVGDPLVGPWIDTLGLPPT